MGYSLAKAVATIALFVSTGLLATQAVAAGGTDQEINNGIIFTFPRATLAENECVFAKVYTYTGVTEEKVVKSCDFEESENEVRTTHYVYLYLPVGLSAYQCAFSKVNTYTGQTLEYVIRNCAK